MEELSICIYYMGKVINLIWSSQSMNFVPKKDLGKMESTLGEIYKKKKKKKALTSADSGGQS